MLSVLGFGLLGNGISEYGVIIECGLGFRILNRAHSKETLSLSRQQLQALATGLRVRFGGRGPLQLQVNRAEPFTLILVL